MGYKQSGYNDKQKGYNKRGWDSSNNNKQNANNNRGWGRSESKNREGSRGENTSYVGAPYNFVSFHKNIVEIKADRLPVHNKISTELLSGEIDYTLKAKTDIFVGSGRKDKGQSERFHRDSKDQYSIPGSTMRGLIRNNAQILGLSSFDDDIDDYRLMYRNVANGEEKKYYNDTLLGNKQVSINPGSKSVGVLTNVKAGYIAKRGGGYCIYKTVVDTLSPELEAMNYYVISERYAADNLDNYPFFKDNMKLLQHDLTKGFYKRENKGRIHWIGEKNRDYKPGYYKVSYEVANVKNISKLGDPGVYSNEGYLVATGPMNEKKALYVVPKLKKDDSFIEIRREDVEAFNIDYENKKNILKGHFRKSAGEGGEDDYFKLPDRDNVFKPVFYIYFEGRLYFGFTPRLRLFYEHSIKDGYKQKRGGFDYAKSIFGCIGKDKTGYKSKVSFADAVLQGTAQEAGPQNMILAGPKPTSYLDYIKQDADNKKYTYNSSGFELRGVKQYWLHKELQKPAETNKEKTATTFTPLKEGAIFKGRIRFNNLTEDELGLLIWSIRLNENSRMNIGKAKAYGYGVVEVTDVKAKAVNIERAYSLDSDLCTDPLEEIDPDKYIDCYKAEVNKKLLGKTIDELVSVQEFFAMKDAASVPDNKDIRYMSIDNREYQSRKVALKDVMETIGKK